MLLFNVTGSKVVLSWEGNLNVNVILSKNDCKAHEVMVC